MKSDLDELIELFEAEKQLLENCIKENTEEWEYLHAHYHLKALSKVNGQLEILYKLKDPFYQQKNDLERMISMYENLDKSIGLISPLDCYYKKKIVDYKDKLKELDAQKSKPVYDNQVIDEALFNVKEGLYNGFILYLNVKDNLCFNFEIVEVDKLDISISVKNVLNAEYFFFDDEKEDDLSVLDIFVGFGFKINNTGAKLSYRYDMKYFKDAISIKTLLSRIIYEVFKYTELDKPASLIYF